VTVEVIIMAITLTESAANRVKGYLAKRGKGEGLRVDVRKSGCSGFAYVINFADDIKPDDRVFEDQGVKVIINAQSLQYLDGSKLDFQKQGLNETFKFINPNVKDECGCGESFSV
jgi:iron-sulfur cluster assembly protein